MTPQDALKLKRTEILSLAQKHGARNVRVFGSVARGEATAESDLDLLVEMDPDKRSPWFPAGLILDLEALLGCKVEVVTPRALHRLIRDRVLKEAVPI